MASGLLDPEFLIGATLANGRFKIVARIGAGSMALVYRAFDHRLETDVVVKVPKKEKLEDPGLRERFNRESRLLVQLQHPHIVRIMDIGMHSNVPYVVMQYLSGGCLQDKLVARNGLPCAVKIPSIRDWVEPVAKALDYAHQQKIVHRDVKPANIMFDHVGNAFLGDFGLTKIMHGDPSEEAVDETAAGFVVGTPNFVAPEIVLGLDYDGRADQYSLGITIYHALLGQPPMRGRSASATMVNQTRRVLPLLSEIRKAVPVKTAEAIARAISKKPDERFSSCVEFANAVIQGLAEGSGAAKVNATAHENVAPDTSGGKSGSDSTSPANSGSSGVFDSSLSSNSPRVSKAKKNGRIDCPLCGHEIRLGPKHAGRIGRCAKCQTRLKIASDLSSLTAMKRANASSNSDDSQSSGNTEDLVIGEKIFGLKLSRNNLVILGILMLIVVVTSLVFFFLQILTPDFEKQQREIEESYQNREG